MTSSKHDILRLTETDLDFLIRVVSPEVSDKSGLKRIIREDEDIRNRFFTEEKVFRRVLDDEEILLKITPRLFFEILLRKALDDLQKIGFTLEKSSTLRVPVFDTQDVADLFRKENILDYLAVMLSSFTRIESYSISFRIKKGFWKTIRFNDMDIQSLISFCEVVEEEHRLGLYKRIADICLFMLGLFPDYTEREFRYPFSGQRRPPVAGQPRISPEEYEEKGRQFYKLAARHQAARDLADVFQTLCDGFRKAIKPLSFMAEHYLHGTRRQLFG
jgi:hypothetical protein